MIKIYDLVIVFYIFFLRTNHLYYITRACMPGGRSRDAQASSPGPLGRLPGGGSGREGPRPPRTWTDLLFRLKNGPFFGVLKNPSWRDILPSWSNIPDLGPQLGPQNGPKYVLNFKSPIATKYCKRFIRTRSGSVWNGAKIEYKIA